MANDIRTVCYDRDLKIEAYRFAGIMQKFPNHFHEYYVVGFIEDGRRRLICNNQEQVIGPGDVVIFNPMDTHTCEQADARPLDYRCLNIGPEAMQNAAFEITGGADLPRFSRNVLYHSDLADSLRELHLMIMAGEPGFEKEELFLLLIEQLLEEDADSRTPPLPQEPSLEIRAACDYLETNYSAAVTLDALSELTGLSKYRLIRTFTRQKGISPYRYLETVRIGMAKKLLEQGVSPAETAFRTGFSDQSHFSNFFKQFIGLTPRQYLKIFLNEPERREAEPRDSA
jgi:AraC-like DNA-binding protein/mannose-6-phosphate isomerase-like protein (cupin superfamily)